jgi:DNA ligase-1
LIEWKWDGIRAQLIRRQHLTLLWSRGEEFMPDCFPEIEIASMNLPNGTVLDGELVAWDHDLGIPKPFGQLQTRLNRRSVSRKLLDSEPVIFIAYDLLEDNSKDLREHPLHIRRSRLQHLLDHHMQCDQIQISPEIKKESWDELMCIRDTSRERKVEGLMLKNANSPYRTGRIKGDWFKWKLNPWTADMVLLYAQRGHGKRATLFSDYTFGVWANGQLLTVAKAYSGLSNQDINQIDQWIKSNTIRRFGPVHEVPPHHVFEIAFEGIQHSARHKSGLALRFPRISRWRTDKKIHEADTLESLKAIIRL